jgi:hypothetical protein
MHRRVRIPQLWAESSRTANHQFATFRCWRSARLTRKLTGRSRAGKQPDGSRPIADMMSVCDHPPMRTPRVLSLLGVSLTMATMTACSPTAVDPVKVERSSDSAPSTIAVASVKVEPGSLLAARKACESNPILRRCLVEQANRTTPADTDICMAANGGPRECSSYNQAGPAPVCGIVIMKDNRCQEIAF